MESSAGTSKEMGRSETIIMPLEPKTAEQEVPWFSISNCVPLVENQYFASDSSMNKQTS